jgi:hypothetical protein
VLYEAAARTRPFVGNGPGAVAEAIVRGEHEPLGQRRPELSPTFVATVERALATEPGERFADAAAMRTALASAGAAPTEPLTAATETAVLPPPARPAPAPQVPTAPTVPTGRPAPVRPARPRRRSAARRLAAVAAVVTILIVMGVLLLTGGGDNTPSAPVAPTTAVAAPSANAPTAPVPAPLARALDRLDQATQP